MVMLAHPDWLCWQGIKAWFSCKSKKPDYKIAMAW